MAKFNIFVHLQAYADQNVSNNPSKNYFKWSSENQGVSVNKPESLQFDLAPGESRTLFDHTRTLTQDMSTTYSLTLKPGTSNTYVLALDSGTPPGFRIARTTGADATSELTITKNGSVLTYASSGGTSLDLIVGGVVVGDKVSIGTAFNPSNRGLYAVLARTATSFSVENFGGQAEGPITLGSSFDSQIEIFSALGAQKGDRVAIGPAFGLAAVGTYDVTAVYANRLEFYSTKVLPESAGPVVSDFSIYSSSKQMVYAESNGKTDVSLNGQSTPGIEPFIQGSSKSPGMMFHKATIWSMVVSNPGLEPISVYVAAIE